MPITRMHSLSRRTGNSVEFQMRNNSLMVKKISSKTIDDAVFKTLKVAKKSISSDSKEKYGILKNYLSFVCNAEINKKLLEKSTVIRCKSEIDKKKGVIHKQVMSSIKMDCSMCSAPLQHYFTSLLDKNSEMKRLSAEDRNQVLNEVYEFLDNKIDEKIIEKNLKMPTIRQAKALISVICEGELGTSDENKEVKKRFSSLLLENFNMDFNIESFKDETINEINEVFEKYC
ncbi:conjugal transfer protein TraA [Grimontia hollisae]|uniref:conjugal transfer protein TraA n=1 Tax=Grimontia hollisae TaxID=673 RepID=UPI000DF8AB2F|nr:conjugal transfer protein TraA [Grimontia hollisae]STQ76566.1 Uncharacterised protein [Grimontia hollisae]